VPPFPEHADEPWYGATHRADADRDAHHARAQHLVDLSESTYEWARNQWLVPINFTAAQLLKIAGQLLQVDIGARYTNSIAAPAPRLDGTRISP
jgi:hypothetical protein